MNKIPLPIYEQLEGYRKALKAFVNDPTAKRLAPDFVRSILKNEKTADADAKVICQHMPLNVMFSGVEVMRKTGFDKHGFYRARCRLEELGYLEVTRVGTRKSDVRYILRRRMQ